MTKTLALTGLISIAATGLLTAEEPTLERPWTLMVYGAADNNADGPILDFLDDVRAAIDDDAGIELVLFIDRSEGFSTDSTSLGADFTGARIYRLKKDSAELLDASEYFPGMGGEEEFEVDSADPENIGQFVAFCKDRFPARNYGLMIYSHADGCTMCPDDESGRDMSIPELTDWVGEEASVDLLALELCNMGGIEIAYQWRPGNGGFSADVLVAIPNAGPPLDWDRAFARIRSEGHTTTAEGATLDPETMTAVDFGRLVVREGYLGRKAMANRHPEMKAHFGFEAAACYDLREVTKVKVAVDAMAVALAQGDNKEILEELRGPGDSGTVMNYVKDNFIERPYVDLFDLCQRIASSAELDGDVKAAAAGVSAALPGFVVDSFGMDGYQNFQPAKNGVFIVFPDGDAEVAGLFGSSRVWQNFGWYTPLGSDEEGAPYGHWAFLGDGATPDNGEIENWFELMDAWFDDTSSDPGGFNHYAW